MGPERARPGTGQGRVWRRGHRRSRASDWFEGGTKTLGTAQAPARAGGGATPRESRRGIAKPRGIGLGAGCRRGRAPIGCGAPGAQPNRGAGGSRSLRVEIGAPCGRSRKQPSELLRVGRTGWKRRVLALVKVNKPNKLVLGATEFRVSPDCGFLRPKEGLLPFSFWIAILKKSLLPPLHLCFL